MFCFTGCKVESPQGTKSQNLSQTSRNTGQNSENPSSSQTHIPNGSESSSGEEVPPQVSPKGSSPTEDLTSSWSDQLQWEVAPIESSSDCPDSDGDGYVSAVACPDLAPEKLDCDDTDVAVTPANERFVRQGPFIMGSASDHAGSDEGPVHVVLMSGYCLDTVEVSTADWSEWLVNKGLSPKGDDVRGVDSDGMVEDGRGDYPAEGVTWAEANQYCEDNGQSLPTEAQWEKAARGGCELGSSATSCDEEDLRAYPWGSDAPICENSNHQTTANGMPELCVSDTMKVHTLQGSAGPYGHLHLSGNVWEYVADTYHPSVYGGERVDPAGPRIGDVHVLRGGGWNPFSTNMRAANRFHDMVMGSAAGFRCARNTVEPVFDDVEPLEMITLSGTVQSKRGKVEGRALYITVFDQNDTDPNTGMLAPGRSPVAEKRMSPTGGKVIEFSLDVPKGKTYLLFAALDDGSGAQKDEYVSASGSGGFGPAKENPIVADKSVGEIGILMEAPPEGGAAPSGPPGPPPNSGQQQGQQTTGQQKYTGSPQQNNRQQRNNNGTVGVHPPNRNNNSQRQQNSQNQPNRRNR